MKLTDALRVLGGERGERLAAQLRLRSGRLPGAVGISSAESAELDRARLLAIAVERRVRLRDVLRAWERGHRVSAAPIAALADLLLPQIGEPPYTAAWHGHPCQPFVHSGDGPSVRAVRAALDRLISRYGANALVVDVLGRLEADRTDHVIGTDEVSDGPHTDPNADSHGGDGNSGECDAAAETSAADREGGDDQSNPGDQAGGEPGSMTGTTGAASGGTGCDNDSARNEADAAAVTPDRQSADERGSVTARQGGAGSERADSATREGAEQPTGEGDNGGDEPTGEMGTQQPDRDRAGDDTAAAHGRPAEAGDGDDLAARATGASTAGDAGSPGGQFLDAALSRIDQLARRARRDGARVADLLRRIIEAQCAPRGRESPRVDARALVRELVSRRVALHRTRRKECEIRDLVIAVDESGSCAHTVNATYAAALAAARALPRERVSVLVHTNGRMIRAGDICAPWVRRILSAHERDMRRNYYSRLQREASEAVWSAIARARPGLVLAMGDHDAHWALESVHAAGVPVLMLAHAPYEADYPALGPVIDASSAVRALVHFSRGGAYASK